MLAHYRLHSRLSAGGTPEVWLAEDAQRGRRVVVRVLAEADPERLQHLLEHARAAAAIHHPNIAQIQEVGEAGGLHFLASEYVEGRTLAARLRSGKMPVDEILDIAIQVGEALRAAHANDVYHGDLKPGNIMITPQGRVKLLNLGLAGKPASMLGDMARGQAVPDLTVSAAQYMSPEQVQGRDLDCRSDLFSLGVVIYEMSTEKRPFHGRTASEVIAQIFQAEPAPMTPFAPPELEEVVLKCLAKKSAARHQTAAELLAALRHIGQSESLGRRRRFAAIAAAAVLLLAAGGAYVALQLGDRQVRSLAVLPLMNAGADAGQEYLGDGIAESLIGSLPQTLEFKVLPRSASFRYKGRENNPGLAAKELGVEAALTGRVSESAGALSVRLQMVAAADSRQIWGAQYEGPLRDLAAMQQAITRDVSVRLRLPFTAEQQEMLGKRFPRSGEAWRLYLQGRHSFHQGSVAGLRRARELLQQAVTGEPSFALAHAGLADVYADPVFPPAEGRTRSTEAALKAFALEEKLAEGHASVGWVRFLFDWNWSDSEREFRRAIQLDSSYLATLQRYGEMLSALGRIREAREIIQRARDRDPSSLEIAASHARVLYFTRRYDDAIEVGRKLLLLDPNLQPALAIQGRGLLAKGQAVEAIRLLNSQAAVSPEGIATPEVLTTLSCAYSALKHKEGEDKALEMLESLSRQRYVGPYWFAALHACRSERDKTFQWLEKAYAERSQALPYLNVDPFFNPIRAEPRFEAMLQRIGLMESTSNILRSNPGVVP